MERAINETAEYCRHREAFGKSLLHNQYIQYKLAELATEVELLRSLIYRITGMYCLYVGQCHVKLSFILRD